MIELLLAPSGYGKSHYLNSLAQAPNALILVERCSGTDAFLAHLQAQVLKKGLTPPHPSSPFEWEAFFRKSEVHLLIDHWEAYETQAGILSFVQELLGYCSTDINLTLASWKMPKLPLAPFFAAGQVKVRDSSFFELDQVKVKLKWADSGWVWDAESEAFWADSQAWPMGWFLFEEYKHGGFSKEVYEGQLALAISQGLSSLGHFSDEASVIQSCLSQGAILSPLWKKHLEKEYVSSPVLWLARALDTSSLQKKYLFLKRAHQLNLHGGAEISLTVLTRLAHTASLKGDWQALDQALERAEPFFDLGKTDDQAAWLYLKANWARQHCDYGLLDSLLERISNLQSQSVILTNFQTRSYILKGLAAYQQGQFEQTREAYQSALILADADQNNPMVLELKIMLAFLDALEGISTDLPESLILEVEESPLASQAMSWLNLTFLWLMGESLDLERGEAILTRVKSSAKTLGWDFLTPLISDISARLYRFHQDYERALTEHDSALNLLPLKTFESDHALLNKALTLIKSKERSAAKVLLEQVIQRAKESGSKAMLQEAQAALLPLDPDVFEPSFKIVSNQVASQKTELRIQMFGRFQVWVGETLIDRWPRKKARQLLIQLLFHPHGIHRESLAEWLSGQDNPAQALRQLDVHVHSLRKQLEPKRKGKSASQYIQFKSASYQFNWDSDYRWDLELFESLYQNWLSSKEDRVQAGEWAGQAIAIYQGPLLPGLDFADDWHSERECYQRKALAILAWQVSQLIAEKKYHQAELLTEKSLQWDPCHIESLKSLLNVAFYQKDKARLVKIYERIQLVFDAELDLSPDPELENMYEKYFDQI